MRNLKKVLSLVLCVAMMLSVMVMGAGAAFTDQDKIVNEEAVDMISALGIVDGYEDDSFQPEKNIERGEAAKMIAVMLNGGKDAVQDTSVSSFNDVLGSADAWANKYIEYGVSKGILAGVGGDRFAPASNVTGTQLAKMLLVSLGYDADKEGYLDDTSWAVNVNADAASAGLYAGVESIDMSAALTRDNAAQMIWNALQANTVRYSILGGLTENRTTLLQDAFGDDYGLYNGVMVQVYYNQDEAEYTYSIADINVDRDGWWNGVIAGENPLDGADTFVSTADYSDLFAMNVTVLRNGDDALLIRVNEGGTVVEGVMGDIDFNNANRNTFTVNGQKYRLDNTTNDITRIVVAYNGVDDLFTRTTVRALDQYSFRAIDLDGGGDVDLIVYYPYAVLKTDRTLSDSFRANVIEWNDASMVVDNDSRYWAQDRDLIEDLGLSFGNNIAANNATASAVIEYEDVNVNGTVAEEGYVMAVPAEFTATGIDTYTVLDIQSAAATSLNSADRMITLGSTEYDGTLLDWINPVSTISLGDTYAYVEVNGYLFIVDGNNIGPVKDEYVVVTKTAAVPHGVDKLWETNILKTDGTTETVDVYATLDTDSRTAPVVGSLYTIDTDLDGNYRLISVDEGTYGTDFKTENTNFDIQQAYKDGATLNNEGYFNLVKEGYYEYSGVTASKENPYGYVGTQDEADSNDTPYNLAITVTEEFYGLKYYNISAVEYDANGAPTYTAEEVITESSIQNGDWDMYIGQENGKTAPETYCYNLKVTYSEAEYEWVENLGIRGMYDTNTAGGFFKDMRTNLTAPTYQIEDDAVIFVYNRMMDEYSVVKGSDLENIAVGEISWAFTGATAKVYNGTPTVDLGYVAVDNDPDETLVYAYVDSNPIRAMNANGNYVLTVDVILDGGQTVTLTSKEYAQQNDPDLMRILRALTDDDDGIFQLIVDDSTLIDIKDYSPAADGTFKVTAALYDGVIMLNNVKYFVDADTEFIPVSGEASSIGEIVKGEEVDIILDKDADGAPTHDILAVIY